VTAARARFAHLAGLADERIDLAEAALWIAAEEYPGLDVQHYVSRLAQLAARAHERLERVTGAAARVAALNDFLYREEGFAGNRADYYDARNSFLNEVLERRTGIPITLAIVYTWIAARIGLPARGVGFPGHFLVRIAQPDEVLVDPFTGEIVSRAQCEERLRATAGEDDLELHPSLLEPTPARQILARVLRNLKQVWLAREEWQRALACAERILLVAPDAPLELRDRGLVYEKLECFAAAADDLERFLTLAPVDESAPAVRERLLALAPRARLLH